MSQATNRIITIDEVGQEIIDVLQEVVLSENVLDDNIFYVIKDKRHGKHILMKLPHYPLMDITQYAQSADLETISDGFTNITLHLRGKGIYLHCT